MKCNFSVLCISAVLFFLFSCESGIKKDFTSGLKITNNGLSFTESYINVDGKKSTGSEFPLNSVVELHFEGVNGFTLENDMVFLGASMTLVDSKNTEILHYPDLFADYDSTGVSPIDAKLIYLSLSTASPMEAGEKYMWKTRVWDKKGKGEINTEMEISVK